MSHHLLNRKDAPFAENVWGLIDTAVTEAAKSQLSVRRIVDIEGPYGLGTKSVPGADEPTREKTQVGGAVATVVGAPTLPLAGILSGFTLASRDIAAFEATGLAFDTKPAAAAGIACARQEDSVLLYGSSALGTDGLLSVKGSISHKLRPWKQVGAAADDVIAAVTKLTRRASTALMHWPSRRRYITSCCAVTSRGRQLNSST